MSRTVSDGCWGTSVNGTDHGALGRLCLARLGLFRCVRFTNRFTQQAIDLRFLPLPILLATVIPRAVVGVSRQATAEWLAVDTTKAAQTMWSEKDVERHE